MKKLIAVLTLLIGLSIANEASASVGTISVTTNKVGSTVNTYVKNNDNNNDNIVTLQLQKSGITVDTQVVTVNRNQQAKSVYKLTSKGSYRIKYTVNGKYSYTSTFYY